MKNPYEKILKEIADGLFNTGEIRPYFSNNALLDATLIFQSVLMDKIFENQNYDNMPRKQRLEMAEACGKDLRKLIHTYTNLDTFKLVEEYEPKS